MELCTHTIAHAQIAKAKCVVIYIAAVYMDIHLPEQAASMHAAVHQAGSYF